VDVLKTLYLQLLRGQVSAADVARLAGEHPEYFEFNVHCGPADADGFVEITLSAKGLYNIKHMRAVLEAEACPATTMRELVVSSARLPGPRASQLRLR
jgi:hypothetical protein